MPLVRHLHTCCKTWSHAVSFGSAGQVSDVDGGWQPEVCGISNSPVDMENIPFFFKRVLYIYILYIFASVVGLGISEPATVVIPRHEFRGFLGGMP